MTVMMMGFGAVQIALARGIKVITTADVTHADKLRGFGATVTAYSDGMVERVRALGPVDLVLDTASGALPDLIRIVDGNPRRVVTIANHSPALLIGPGEDEIARFGERRWMLMLAVRNTNPGSIAGCSPWRRPSSGCCPGPRRRRRHSRRPG